VFTSPVLRRAVPLTLAGTLFLPAAGCGGGGGNDGADRAAITAGFYPMAWLAEEVGGAAVAVRTLTKPGAEPHDLELAPRQLAELGKAKLVIYVKGLQPAVDEAVQQHAEDRGLDAASLVKTLPPPADGHEAADGHEQPEAGHDPHIWLDPARMATVASKLGERLAEADPGQAAAYRANAKALAAELGKLDTEFSTGLRDCPRKSIVTAHAAFGYLADRYGLTQISIAGIDPQSEPSPKRLAELTHEVRDSGATTVFTETLVSPKVAETLAREAGVRTATLDPVEGVAEGSGADYLSLMRQNLRTLRTALSCR
jgi:zinc transport system substrate-binding protein